jgi:hypothetical protein
MRLLVACVMAAAAALACGGPASAPASPSPLSITEAASAADGSTLKVTAPALQLPANGSSVTSLTPNLVVANATFRFLGDVPFVRTLQYRFVVETASGSRVSDVLTGAGVELTGSRVPAGLLEPQTTYRWRVRAELGGAFGPWSASWTFTTPKA